MHTKVSETLLGWWAPFYLARFAWYLSGSFAVRIGMQMSEDGQFLT